MKGKHQFLSAFADGADLPGEALPGETIVEIAGEGRVLIENHFGVIQYTPERICINVQYGKLCILGCSLKLARMSKQQLVICGQINSISLLRRGN